MKVLLINPPEKTHSSRSLRLKLPPLGILYIAAYLERSGIPVEVLDANVDDLTVERTVSAAVKADPAIVGVTATTVTLQNALSIISGIKRARPDIVSMIGGPHVTYRPSETLAGCRELDLVVLGEGEETTTELARALNGFGTGNAGPADARELSGRASGVRGIAYRDPEDPGRVRYTDPRPVIEDLDSIPFPARHLVPFNRYKILNETKPSGIIMTSRGCPFACNYCISSRMAGISFRGRSAKNVVDEIEALNRQYGLTEFEFIDDLFTLVRKRARSISDEIMARGLDIRWSASSRVNTINRDMVASFKRSGLNALYFGVESGSQRVLDLMNKKTTLQQIETAFKVSKEFGVDTIGSFMLGYPGETLDEMKQTIRFSTKLDPDLAQFTILTPYPGTPIYDSLSARGLIESVEWDAYDFVNPVIKYDPFGYTGRNVKNMLIRAYVSFYLRPSFLWRHRGMIPTSIRTMLGVIKGLS